MPFRFWVLKKIIPLLLFIGFVITCDAQKPRFNIFAGPQMSTARYSITDVEQSTEYKTGFQAGFGMKIPFETNLFFSPAVFYSLKGYKVKFNRYADPPDLTAIDNNTTIRTFELAFLLQYDLGKKPSHFFIKAGPSFDLQLKGKEEFNLMDGSHVNRSMVYDFGKYGRYCGNLLLQLGFETKGFMIFGQYSHGVANLNNADEGPKINYRVYGISLGTYFGGKKIPDSPKKP